MNRKAKTQRGITLIALVITIIVMLILVAVTISMAVNGGLFNYAGKAAGDTQNALDIEQQLANGGLEVGGVWYDSIDDYLNHLKGKPAVTTIHSWTRSGDTFTCSHCNTTYTIGQTVNYTATGTSIMYGHKLGLTESAEAEGNEIEVTSQSTTWVVLGIEDTNEDGVNEALLITSAGPVGVVVDGSAMETLPMRGAAAYNNGPSEVNRICEELYSNNEYGKARGMTIEDVNEALKYTPLGGFYYNSGYKTTGNLTTKLKDIPTWDNIKGNCKTPDGANTEAAFGEYELNGYYYYLNGDGTALANDVNSTTSFITTVEKNTIFGENKDYVYWLASRGVYALSDYAIFGPGYVGDGRARSCHGFFTSIGNEGISEAALRPVVSLTSKLPVSE